MSSSPEAKPRVLIVAGTVATELPDALAARAAGSFEVEAAPSAPPGEDGSARAIGARMVALEALARDRLPDAAVIATHESEALAAAIAFSKLELPIAGLVEPGEESRDGMIAERLCELVLCCDEAALARVRRAGLGERARVVGGPSSEDALDALTAWILSRIPGS